MSAIQNLDSSRPLRADARRNYDLLIRAADLEFTAHGAAASLEEIARRARLGIGTLYRHFPTRDDLIAGLLEDRLQALIAAAARLARDPSPGAALAAWLRALLAHAASYRGLAGTVTARLV